MRPPTAKHLVGPFAAGLFCCLLLAFASAASAAPAWLAPTPVSAPGRDASNVALGVDDAGRTTVVWERVHSNNPSHDVQASTREPGAGFAAPADLSLRAENPELSVSPGGQAAAVWRHFANPPGNYVIEVATRAPGGAFSAPVAVAALPVNVTPNAIRVAVDDAGDTVVAWTQIDPASGLAPNPTYVAASVRPAGGSFSAPVRVSPPRLFPPGGMNTTEEEEWEDEQALRNASGPRLAIDPAGNAFAVWQYFDGTDIRVQTAIRPPGGSFSAPASLSAAGEDASEPDVATDAAGDATVVWGRNEGSDHIVQTATRPSGGSFGPVDDITDPGALATGPTIEVTPGGTAAVVWRQSVGPEGFIDASIRPPGGSFSAPEPVSLDGEVPFFQRFAMNASGAIVVAWSASSSLQRAVHAVVRPPGGTLSAPVEISPLSENFFHPTVAIDGAGNATVAWIGSDGTNQLVQAAGYDALPPVLDGVSIPSSGTVGVPVSFSVSPFDAWPIAPASFEFGDGGKASGNAVSHVYSAPGTYEVTAGVADATGATATAKGSIAIVPRNDLSLGKLKRNKKKGTATLAVSVPGPGAVTLSGKGIGKVSRRASQATTLTLPIKPKGKGVKSLNRHGKWKSTLKVSFAPDGGTSTNVTKKVTLVKKQG